MERLLIKGGRIIDPSRGVDRVGDLLIVDGKIAGIEEVVEPSEGAQIIEAAGMVVSPGFIDLHCHLREPGPGVQGDGSDRYTRGGEGRVHHGLRDAEHGADDAHPRYGGVRAW